MTKEQHLDRIMLPGGERQEVVSSRRGVEVDSVTHFTNEGARKWQVTTHHDSEGRMIGFERVKFEEGKEVERSMTLIKHTELHRWENTEERMFKGGEGMVEFLPVCYMVDYTCDLDGAWHVSKEDDGNEVGNPVLVVADNIIAQGGESERRVLARKSPDRVSLELLPDRENGGYTDGRPYMRWSYEIQAKTHNRDGMVEVIPDVHVNKQIRMDGKGDGIRPALGDKTGTTPLLVYYGGQRDYQLVRDIDGIGNPGRYGNVKELEWKGMTVLFPKNFVNSEKLLEWSAGN